MQPHSGREQVNPDFDKSKSEAVSFVFYSYDHRKLNRAILDIIQTVRSANSNVSGPIALPNSKVTVCVNRSPHVYSKGKDHFSRITYARYIKIHQYQQVEPMLKKQDLPAGVYVKVLVKRKKPLQATVVTKPSPVVVAKQKGGK